MSGVRGQAFLFFLEVPLAKRQRSGDGGGKELPDLFVAGSGAKSALTASLTPMANRQLLPSLLKRELIDHLPH